MKYICFKVWLKCDKNHANLCEDYIHFCYRLVGNSRVSFLLGRIMFRINTKHLFDACTIFCKSCGFLNNGRKDTGDARIVALCMFPNLYIPRDAFTKD